MMNETLLTEESRLRREHHKGQYDRETVYRILDENPFCHLAFVKQGRPVVIPTMQWRVSDMVYWHGSSKSRIAHGNDNATVCLTASRIDGLVLARSAFEHTVNFESVVVIGEAQVIEDEKHKASLLEAFFSHLFPGRWDALRTMTAQELKATAVMGLPLHSASAKIRRGPPNEPEEDRATRVWAGVLPMAMQLGVPIPDEFNTMPEPDYLARLRTKP
ncbi:pyridoxamine 5'-phosphate oxidase family protein [Allorhizobium undicola]|uniref:pyridoxamine 5'-phosphate oxidase family protein n=1 Tax=Allorhizobium undicola TaxID=78527 RepID=UPI003D34C51A